jgi:hypothetical protein
MPKGEQSDFASKGHESFPPTHMDNLDVHNFSDEKKWPTQKLIGRLSMYSKFLERPDIMPRARKVASRIIEHVLFELPYRGLYLDFDFENEDDCPTQPIDSNELRNMLDLE